MTSIAEEYNVSKARQLIILRDNKDNTVQGAQLDQMSMLKWKEPDALKESEVSLEHMMCLGKAKTTDQVNIIGQLHMELSREPQQQE